MSLAGPNRSVRIDPNSDSRATRCFRQIPAIKSGWNSIPWSLMPNGKAHIQVGMKAVVHAITSTSPPLPSTPSGLRRFSRSKCCQKGNGLSNSGLVGSIGAAGIASTAETAARGATLHGPHALTPEWIDNTCMASPRLQLVQRWNTGETRMPAPHAR
jgi:hypothetical protein